MLRGLSSEGAGETEARLIRGTYVEWWIMGDIGRFPMPSLDRGGAIGGLPACTSVWCGGSSRRVSVRNGGTLPGASRCRFQE